MYSACRSAVALALLCLSCHVEARELRVCADPNNLPFSNEAGEGFENAIVALIAQDFGASVRYTWWAQRRGFVRNTLNANACDLVPGIALGTDVLRTTRPYYRSTYVFATRTGAAAPASLDDPALAAMLIGVQLVGDDGANPPPALALAARGITGTVRGFSVYGDYAQTNPPARILQALAAGEIDVAIVWGPLAGYFASRETTPIKIAPVVPQADGPRRPMAFDIAMGVRKDDTVLRDEINGVLARRKGEIDAVLAAYGVPRVDGPALAGPALAGDAR